MDTRDFQEPRVPARFAPRTAPAQARGPVPEARPAQAVTVRVILRGLARYWWQLLAVWIIGSTALAGLVYSHYKPEYEATSVIHAEPGTGELFLGMSVRSADSSGTYLATQRELITSASVLSAVAADLAVQKTEKISKAAGKDTTAELRKSLVVTVMPGTTLIQVAMRSPSPTEAALIVNKVVQSFVSAQAEWNDDATRLQIAKLKEVSKKLEADLQDRDRRWRELVAKSGVEPMLTAPARPGPDGAPTSGVKKVSEEEFRSLRQQLIQTTLDLIQAEAMLARRQKEKVPAAPDPRVKLARQLEDRLKTDPELLQSWDEVKKARDGLEGVKRLTRNPLDPAVKKHGQRAADAWARYQALRESKEMLFREKLETEQVADPNRGLREAEEKVGYLRGLKDAFDKELKQIDDSQKKNATTAVDIQVVTEEREGIREMKASVDKRLEQLTFESKGEARLTVVDRAFPPGVPISDKRLKMMAALPVGLLGGLLGLAMIVELRSGRVSHPDELAPLVPVEVFSIPPLPMRRLESKSRNQSELIEVFAQRLDHLRVALGIDAGTTQLGRCVMITSAMGGEGKTTLAAQLGGRCASAGIRTLLIDADLRRATLSKMLDVPQGQGLVNVLGGTSEIAEAVVNIDGAGSLFLLPAGMSGMDAGRVFRGPDLGRMLEQLREEFELILIDTPPVLPVPDALTVGQWVDGSLIAARSDTSRFNLVGRASRMLSSARIPVLGVVVNGVRSEGTYGDYAYRYSQTSATESATAPTDGGPGPGGGAPR